MPLATRVPQARRIVPIGADVRVGRAVSARPWGELAALVQYLRGRGAVLVTGHAPNVHVDATGQTAFPTSEVLRYRTQPTGRAIARVWAVEVLGAGASGGAASLTSGSGPTLVATAGTGTDARGRVYVLVETATKTTSTSELTLTIGALSGQLRVVGVTCWELPRAQLTKDATDLGIDLGTIDPDRPIWDRDYESVNGVCEALAGADGRRVALASWSGFECETSSTSYVDAFTVPLRIVPPKIGPTDTTRTCTWDIRAWCDGGTTGDARIVDAASGASSALSIGSSTPGWRGTGTKSFLCEDLAQATGLPSGSFETVQLQVRRTSGAGKVYWDGWVLFDGAW